MDKNSRQNVRQIVSSKKRFLDGNKIKRSLMINWPQVLMRSRSLSYFFILENMQSYRFGVTLKRNANLFYHCYLG